MRCCIVPSKITGRGYRYPKVPAQTKEGSASFVRYEKKDEQTGNICDAAPYRAICMVRRQESAEVIVAKCRGQCPGHGWPGARVRFPWLCFCAR